MAIESRKTKVNEIRYVVRVRDSLGRWYPTQSFDRKVDAERHERSLFTLRDKGDIAKSKAIRTLTMGQYWTLWSKQCRGQVSEGWKKSQDQMMRDHVLPVLTEYRISEVRSSLIAQLMNGLREKGLGAQTTVHVYNLIHKMFEDACHEYEYLDVNPVKRKYRPRVRREEREFLSPDESRKLLSHCRDHFLGPAIWISILSGLRPNEVQALSMSSVDFEKGQISIRAGFKRKVNRIEPYPKQSDWGLTAMPPTLVTYLTEKCAGKVSTDFVVTAERGGMLDYNIFNRLLKKLCREAGAKEITPHELRHSCTELYVEAGASAEDIRRLLNQSCLKATERYMHRTEERLGRIAKGVCAIKVELVPEKLARSA